MYTKINIIINIYSYFQNSPLPLVHVDFQPLLVMPSLGLKSLLKMSWSTPPSAHLTSTSWMNLELSEIMYNFQSFSSNFSDHQSTSINQRCIIFFLILLSILISDRFILNPSSFDLPSRVHWSSSHSTVLSMERKKRTRKVSIRLRDCVVLVDNVMKRVKTTSGLESGAINR